MIVDTGAAAGPDDGPVSSLGRGLRLLMALVSHRAPMTAPELSRRLDLPRIAVFRLLATLEAAGYVERTGVGHRYRVGLAVLRLGFDHLASMDLAKLSGPVLRKLCGEVAHPCHLAVRDGPSVIYVAKAEPDSVLASGIAVGTSLPAYATVSGRVLLGALSLAELRGLYPKTTLQRHADDAPRSVTALFDRVRQDGERGYVMHESSLAGNVAAVAVPVRNRAGAMVAAIGVTIRASRLNEAEMENLVTKASLAARDLSSVLGEREGKDVER